LFLADKKLKPKQAIYLLGLFMLAKDEKPCRAVAVDQGKIPKHVQGIGTNEHPEIEWMTPRQMISELRVTLAYIRHDSPFFKKVLRGKRN
jgi:hypothetical protein